MSVDAPVQERPVDQSTALEKAGDNKPMNRTGAMGFGLAPRNFDEAWRMAGIFAGTEMVPKNYQGKPADILVAMQYGAEVNLPPMASLQSIGVINGKPGLYGDGFLGVIQSTPAYDKHKEYYELADGTQTKNLRQDDYKNDDTTAVAMFWRKGNPEPFVGTFSIGDAKRAQLWGKSGPWSTAPARMLLWRARGYAGRNGFSAELRGIKTVEEILDTPVDELAADTIDAPPAEPVRRSEKNVTPAPESPASSTSAAPCADAGANTPATPTTSAAADSKPVTNSPAAAPASPASAGPGQTTKNIRISEQLYIGKSKISDKPYYEVKGEEMVNGRARAGHTWVTQDEQLAKMSASCEGTDSLFTITWHLGHLSGAQTTAKPVRILTAIAGA